MVEKNFKEEEEEAAAPAVKDISKERKRYCRSSNNNTDKIIIIIIPDEIIFDILLKIPFENVVKFKYVCKSWYAMISSDPVFSNRFLEPIRNNNKKNKESGLEGMKLDHKYFYTTPPLDFYEHPIPPIVLRSVNGLVCMIGEGDDKLNYICNPTTREFRSFPNCRSHLHPQGNRGYGFGYSHQSSSSSRNLVYKVIQVSSTCLLYDPNDWDPDSIQCMIHTLGSKSWRRIKSPNYPLFKDSVFVDGVMYWLVRTKVVGLVKIVSFDVGDEEFGELSPPIEICLDHNKRSNHMQLVELNGSLHLIDWILKRDVRDRIWRELSIWRMLKQVDMADNTVKSNCESCWVREYQIYSMDFPVDDDVANFFQLMQIQDGKILFRQLGISTPVMVKRGLQVQGCERPRNFTGECIGAWSKTCMADLVEVGEAVALVEAYHLGPFDQD
ncbi:F-box domain [Macleaya cordata]|uniref:F-box domain n=1 Tax=Macleaya cordata TaxID=56857 RepID=A0A200RBV3_MACCD|nr:F-box domain [Macleaya cordata]